MSPTARSLAYLRNAGYMVDKVEQRLPIPGKFISRDLFGIGDILALKPGEILLVQVTTASNLSAREKKALRSAGLRAWLAAGGKFELHGWAKRGGRGERKTWQVTIRPLVLEESAF